MKWAHALCSERKQDNWIDLGHCADYQRVLTIPGSSPSLWGLGKDLLERARRGKRERDGRLGVTCTNEEKVRQNIHMGLWGFLCSDPSVITSRFSDLKSALIMVPEYILSSSLRVRHIWKYTHSYTHTAECCCEIPIWAVIEVLVGSPLLREEFSHLTVRGLVFLQVHGCLASNPDSQWRKVAD